MGAEQEGFILFIVFNEVFLFTILSLIGTLTKTLPSYLTDYKKDEESYSVSEFPSDFFCSGLHWFFHIPVLHGCFIDRNHESISFLPPKSATTACPSS